MAAVSGSRAGVCDQRPATADLAHLAGSVGGGCAEGSERRRGGPDGKAQGVRLALLL